MFIRNKKAQSTIEYGILFAVVIGAILVIQSYMKQGAQGIVQARVDQMLTAHGGQLYNPPGYSSDIDTTVDAQETETEDDFGQYGVAIDHETTTRSGTQTSQ